MTYVTAQIGTKPHLPEHMKPPARVAAVRARSEEEYGRLMMATAPKREPEVEYTHKRTLRERICDFLAETGRPQRAKSSRAPASSRAAPAPRSQ